MKKRQLKPKQALDWNTFYMSLAKLCSFRSKDPGTRVGACVVNQKNELISIGYNGMPRGCSESNLTWNKNSGLDSKYWYVCHAEFNAIINAPFRNELENSKIYVSLFPCNECAKAIIQSGIKEIVYESDKYMNKNEVKASKRMLSLAGVKLTQFKNKKMKIEEK